MKYNIVGSKISSVVAFFLLISKTGGVGIMIIPYAMQHSGIILISLFYGCNEFFLTSKLNYIQKNSKEFK